jgi:hypothetical protein
MKTKFSLIAIFGFVFTSCLIAQGPMPFSVPHLSFGLCYARTNVNIDTMFVYDRNRGENEPFITYYTRSEDLLTDTIHSPTSWRVLHFNEKNQLIYDHGNPTKWGGYNGYVRTDYEYDTEGRLIREELNSINLDENTKEFQGEKVWDYSSIQMTEKGYIYGGVECELDSIGRITLLKCKTPFDRFVEFEGKTYRLNDAYYSYTDTSFTEYGCYPYFDHPNDFAESPFHWMRSIYVYNEYGDQKEYSMFIAEDGINWRLVEYYRMEYAYNASRTNFETGVSNDYASQSKTTVYAHSGAVYVVTDNATTVQVFDISGRLVKQQAVSQGENRINVPSSGLYFVKVGNESFKVFIR